MGWDFTYGASRMDAANEATQDFATPKGRVMRLKRTFRGNVCYSMHRFESVTGESDTWICVTLLRRSREGWGYKLMDEDSGPYYFGVPEKWLAELSPPHTEFAREWRARVARAHEIRREQGLTLAAATRLMLQEVATQDALVAKSVQQGEGG